MKYLIEKLNTISKVVNKKTIALFLDYDGTIAPMAENPDKALPPGKTVKILNELRSMENIKIAIVSGRSLKNVKNILGVKGLVYAGNHGLEIEGPDVNYSVKVPANVTALVQDIKRMLSFKLASMKGVLIEDKGIAVALHYRNIDQSVF
jgi:trehalose-phosphatase